MALSTQAILFAKRRALNFALKPKTRLQIDALFRYFSQFAPPGGPDLQIVEFTFLSSTDVVIADAACKLYAVVLIKDTGTATFSKLTDHATTSSDTAAEYVVWQSGAGDERALIFPDGQAFANGITMQGNTTADGGTGSAGNGARGFVILGAA